MERVEDIFQGVVVTMRLVTDRLNGSTKPSFNVCEPFPGPLDYELCESYPNKRGITIVQMNRTMADMLVAFIMDSEDLEPVLRDLCDAFAHSDDGIDRSKISHEPQFKVCTEFNGVILLKMNSPMVDIITKFISEVEEDEDIEVIFHAFKSALINPARSREIRSQKREERMRERTPISSGNGGRHRRDDDYEYDDRPRRISRR